jgi:hypothetical protein
MCFAAAHDEELQLKNFIDSAMKCDNPKGNEIKETKHVSAPNGKAFEKDTAKVTTEPQTRSFTDAAGAGGCFLENLDWTTVNIPTKTNHTVPVNLLGFRRARLCRLRSGESDGRPHREKREH